jgi:tRNA A-37 threonylcarbamoyl transferase component Bud32
MHRFKDSIGHKRFAFSELQNNTLARQRGIHTPMCCAYFEQLLFGLVWQSGVVMEDLVDHTELANLMSSGKRTMFDAIPIFKELYCRGVNHIDMSPKNIFVRERDNHFVVIDWQYCSFYPSANDLQLCLMAAVFLLYNNMNYEDSMWHLWLKALFDQCHPEISYDKMLQAVRIMRNRRLRRPARLNLDVSGLGLKEIW